MGAAEQLEYPFWSKLHSWGWQCDRQHSLDAATKFLGQNVVDGWFGYSNSNHYQLPIILTVKR
jgi:hypothetical protein